MTEEEQLQKLQKRVDNVTNEAHLLVSDLNEKQLFWKPDPNSWCIAECFEHLILTGEGWYPQIRNAIEGAKTTEEHEERIYRPSLFGRFFLGTSGEKLRFRVTTHSMFRPEYKETADAHVRFLDQQLILKNLIKDSRELNLRKTKVCFPFTRFLRLNLGEALALLTDQQFRHLNQARNVMQMNSFPQDEKNS